MKCSSLEEVRKNIDRIDNEIVKLISERGAYVIQASTFKRSEDGVKAPDRIEAVISKVRAKAVGYGANPDLIEALYRKMISWFIKTEMDEFHTNTRG
jgi:isochorismate pyruvate lyase